MPGTFTYRDADSVVRRVWKLSARGLDVLSRAICLAGAADVAFDPHDRIPVMWPNRDGRLSSEELVALTDRLCDRDPAELLLAAILDLCSILPAERQGQLREVLSDQDSLSCVVAFDKTHVLQGEDA